MAAYAWDKFGRKLTNTVLNKYRKRNDRPHGSDKTPWEAFLGTETNTILRIYPIGEREKFIIGDVKNTFIPGETDKGIYMRATHGRTRGVGWLVWTSCTNLCGFPDENGL